MPINLTTKWKAGSVDNDAEYTQAKIIEFRMGIEHNRRLDLLVEFGNTVDGVWVKGKTGHFMMELRDYPDTPDYTNFVVANENLYNEVASTLYALLQTLEPEKMAGTMA